MQVAAEDLEDLSAGAVFLATGGGGDPYVAKLATYNLLTELGPAEMIAVEDLDDDAFVVAVGNVGAPTVSLELLPSVQDPAKVVVEFEKSRRTEGRRGGVVRDRRGQLPHSDHGRCQSRCADH